MDSRHLGYTKILTDAKTVDEGVARVAAALKTQGFGVLTDIDVQKTMREKLGTEVRPYRILGACNPPLAHRALSEDPFVGLLLPCNVIVFDTDQGITVSLARPIEMFRLVERPEMATLAETVEQRIRAVFEQL